MNNSPINTTEEYNYQRLQQQLDKVIGKIGLTRTIHLLESFASQISVANERAKVQLVTQYLVNLAIQHFELEEKMFFVSQVREYRDARMCCFHLLRKYTEHTFSKIAISFHCAERSVSYGCHKAEERIAFPKGNVRFTSLYMTMETQLLEYMSKLN